MKILFSDFDGTLVSNGKLKNESDIEMIKKLRSEGHQFVICTGRCLPEIKRDYPKYNIPFDYMILNNGGQIVNNQLETIDSNTIKKETGLSILNELSSIEGMWTYFCDEEVSYGYHDGLLFDQLTGKQERGDFKALYERSLAYYILCFVQVNEGTDRTIPLLKALKEKYNDVEMYLNTIFVDIVPEGCSKGNGIKKLLELLNVECTTYGIGDSFNDLPMIQMVDHGYTFNNVDISNVVNQTVDSVGELIIIMLEEN